MISSALLLGFASLAIADPSLSATLSRKVVGHSVYSYRDVDDSHLHFNLLTNIICHAMELSPEGGATLLCDFQKRWAWTLAHAHRNGVKVSLGIYTTFSQTQFHTLLTTGAAKAVDNIIRLAESYGLDGVDMDLEYPQPSDKANLTAFLNRLAAACHARGWVVSLDIPAANWVGCYDWKVLNDSIDFYFVMCYDYHSQWGDSPLVGPNFPSLAWPGDPSGCHLERGPSCGLLCVRRSILRRRSS